MFLGDFFCDSVYDWWNQYPYKTGRIIVIDGELLIWAVGIIGNLINAVVFRHKSMGSNPINSIFWWLSISDLLELAILGLYQWDGEGDGSFEIINTGVVNTSESSFYFVRYLSYIYLFLVFHTITIGLNIVLIFYQYMIVAYPLRNQNNPLNDRSINLAVICVYILSFVLFLPFWNIYEVQYVKTEWGFGEWECGVRNLEDPLVNVSILVCGIVLRVAPLIILIISCTLLLFAIKNAHRDRQNLGMQAHHLSREQRQVNRMNVTIITIIIMFLITDMPLGISSFLVLSEEYDCRATLERMFLFPLLLINCCYSIFCYLIRIKQYRKTLKLLVSKNNWTSSSTSSRASSAPVTEQSNLELHPL